jgi:hypothetical protein
MISRVVSPLATLARAYATASTDQFGENVSPGETVSKTLRTKE